MDRQIGRLVNMYNRLSANQQMSKEATELYTGYEVVERVVVEVEEVVYPVDSRRTSGIKVTGSDLSASSLRTNLFSLSFICFIFLSMLRKNKFCQNE